MVEEEIGKKQFSLLRPCCVELLKEKRLSSVTKLQQRIESIDSIVPPLLDYVILPLQMTLQHSMRNDTHLTEGTLECMRKLFQHSQLASQKTFCEILSILCAMLEIPSAPVVPELSSYKGVGLSSEELLGQVLQTLQYLMLQANKSVMESFHDSLVLVGHTVSLLISVLETSNRQIKELCVHTLISLTYCNSSNWKDSSVTKNDFYRCLGNGCGEISFASFLPGISTTLCKVILNDSHVGQVVVRLCLLAIAHFISLVLSNNQFDTTISTTNDKKGNSARQLAVSQDSSWWSTTDKNLEKLLSRFLSFANHENWKVRLTLTHSMTAILHNCHKSLSYSCGPSLEVLITLSLDSYTSVSSCVNHCLDSLSILFNSSNSLSYLLEERLYRLSSSLPRLVRGENDSSKLVVLKLLRGYLEFLKSHVSHLTSSPPHMTRLLQSLVQAIELNRVGPFLMESKNDGHISAETVDEDWSLPLSFAHIRDDSTANTVREICHALGRHGNAHVLVDSLLQQVLGSSLHLSEHLLIFHWVLEGAEPEVTLLGRVIEGILELWEEIDKGSVYEICFVLCIIGNVAAKLRNDFVVHLQDVLGVVMATMTSDNSTISLTGINVTNKIAIHTGHRNIIGLIIGCADYIVNTVHHHLMYSSSLQHGCHILQAIITHGDYTILPLLSDCKEALLLSIDQRQSLNECWSVCLTLAKKLPDWVAMETPIDSLGERKEVKEEVKEEEKEDMTMEDISKYFMEYHHKKEQEAKENENIDEEEINEDGNMTDTESKPVPLPSTVQCCIDILQRCIHHISSTDSALRLCTLDCVCHCLTALQYRETELLPEVHNIWSPFLHRLTDAHLPVRIKAIDVLLVMAKVAKEFLRKRVIDQIWPKLVLSLNQLLQSSKHATPTYHHSMEYKLLMKILSTVAELCIKLNVSVANSEEIARCVVLYLSKDVHKSVQTQSIQTCKTLATFDPDLMWLLFVQLSPSLLPSPPHSSLRPIKLPHCTTSELYKDNISLVLN